MRLPRDLTGRDLVRALAWYGYETVRQSGSHAHLQSRVRGHVHSIVIPIHSKPIPVGTLDSILRQVAANLEIEKGALAQELFGDR